ncbi:binding-protein-dependent transport system inner membrane component [Clostridium sp. CAG:1013]|nr:binding-protein-dependent transport system inner membrane component [Clostridium sp. CAG:1013]
MTEKKKTGQGVLLAVRKEWDLYLMLLIPFCLLILFKYVPMGGLIMAFQDFDIFQGFWNSPMVGLQNFKELFSAKEFLSVLINTLSISWYKILFFFPLPIILALILNEVKCSWFKRTVQTIVYLPHFLSWVVVAGLTFDLLSSTGTVNLILSALGMKTVNFLMEPAFFQPIVVGSAIWKEVGYSAIVYLAAISAIDPTLYEAAVMDGAGKWKQLVYVTLPGIVPMIVMMLLIRVGTVMDANVEQIMAMYNPTVYSTGDVIGTYIYRIGLGNMQYSLAAAAGLFNSVVSFTLVFFCNLASKKIVHRSLW